MAPFIIDVQGDSIVVFLCDRNPGQVDALMQQLVGRFGQQDDSFADWTLRNASYSPMFRFRLIQDEGRLYSVDRWCFRGSVDDWIELAVVQPLDRLTRKYLPNLGKQSFYDLM